MQPRVIERMIRLHRIVMAALVAAIHVERRTNSIAGPNVIVSR
jgi:hypothetical protein